MSEEIIPDVPVMSDVLEGKEPAVNYSALTLAELGELFRQLAVSEDRMKRSKEAEAIKSAFYKKLLKEKADVGSAGTVSEPGGTEEEIPVENDPETVSGEVAVEVSENPFDEIERGFKALYNAYRKEKAEYNRQLEKERENNLALKEGVIADLKALIDKQEDVSAAFPEFREIQNRWRAIGPVPVQSFRNLNDTYQLYVEQFYDKVKINRELRDLDFKKNLEAKEKFCREAESLSEKGNVLEAFKELQKLHEQWKEYGPVDKQFREDIWNRFKAATAVINKKYQAYFESQKEQYAENLSAKTALCEKVEGIAEKEISTSGEWNDCTKEIEDIQKQWKTIGYASKKENQKIYERFRAACDRFFERKREYYTAYKSEMNDNLQKKISLCEAAESLKNSTEWKKTADQLINLQKQWKEIGAVPRKKSEALWKRFRAACDEFFNERDKQARPENDYYGNLKAKKQLIEEINAYTPAGDSAADEESMRAFMEKWQAIGFVPFKEKDKIATSYKESMEAKFPEMRSGRASHVRQSKNEKERLIQKYMKKEQDIVTYENNIGFFAASKNSAPLISQMQERIAKAKEELKALELQIRAFDSSDE